MAISIALTGSDQQVITTTGVGIYRGFTIRETTGGAGAVVRIHSGTDNTGTVLDTVALAAGESAREFYPGDGLAVTGGGIYVDVVSGTVEGSVRVG